MLHMRIFKTYCSNLFFTRKVQEIRKKTIDQKKKETQQKNEKQKNKNHAFIIENNYFEN